MIFRFYSDKTKVCFDLYFGGGGGGGLAQHYFIKLHFNSEEVIC